MEEISYLKHFGNKFAEVRKQFNMSQVDFFQFLFPDTYKEEENIKKKMNAIEKGKQKSLDLDILLTVCKKCHVSADYLLGLDTVYCNHEERFVCDYTGLNKFSVSQLHKWAEAQSNDADLSVIRYGCSGPDSSMKIDNAYKKQSALQLLKIVNLLFAERKDKKRKNSNNQYSNISFLHNLYLMCFEKPKRIIGKEYLDKRNQLIKNDDYSMYQYDIDNDIDDISMDATEDVILQDSSEVYYNIDLKYVLEQLAKERLSQDLDWLIKQVKINNTQ